MKNAGFFRDNSVSQFKYISVVLTENPCFRGRNVGQIYILFIFFFHLILIRTHINRCIAKTEEKNHINIVYIYIKSDTGAYECIVPVFIGKRNEVVVEV